MTTTYIVIEVAEKENAGDIVNLLVTQTKSRFTITKNLGEYAAERDKLAETNSQKEQAPLPQNDPEPIQEDDLQIIEPDQMMFVVPKTEQLIHPLEPSHASPIFKEEPPIDQYHQPSPDYYEDWQQGMEASAKSTPGPVRNPKKKYSEKRRSDQTRQKSTGWQCALCPTVVKAIGMSFSSRSIHAITHLDFKRYKCTFKKCDYKSCHRANVQHHMKKFHNGRRGPVHEIMTPKQKAELHDMVEKCFPEMRREDSDVQWDDEEGEAAE